MYLPCWNLLAVLCTAKVRPSGCNTPETMNPECCLTSLWSLVWLPTRSCTQQTTASQQKHNVLDLLNVALRRDILQLAGLSIIYKPTARAMVESTLVRLVFHSSPICARIPSKRSSQIESWTSAAFFGLSYFVLLPLMSFLAGLQRHSIQHV